MKEQKLNLVQACKEGMAKGFYPDLCQVPVAAGAASSCVLTCSRDRRDISPIDIKQIKYVIMKEKLILIVTIFICHLPMTAEADSPLTSTDFHAAYAEESFMQLAMDANGKVNRQISAYLADDNHPIDHKMALINRLGWSTKVQKNARIFLRHLKELKGIDNEKMLTESDSPDLLISYAYLLSMDNYFDVTRAEGFARQAGGLRSGSFTVRMIAGLIAAQNAMQTDWGQVYEICDLVRQDKTLVADMKPEAVEIIFGYIDDYEPYRTKD